MRIALVTGANGGFGKLISIELLASGFQVIAAMRDCNKKDVLVEMAEQLGLLERLEVVEMDVTNSQQILRVKELVEEKYSYMDVIVNNAGFSQGGFLSDLEVEDWQNQFDTNVLGVIQVTKQFLPLLSKSKKGQIINISSVSGYFGFPGMGPYCSSKFALEGLSESLRLELLSENIYVSLVEPASFKTGIWEKGLEIGEMIGEEETLKQNALKFAKSAYHNAGDPQEVANLVRKISETKRPKFRYPVGKGAKSLWLIKKYIPRKIIERTVLKRLEK